MFFLAAADGEDAFYLQLLVVVILAAAVGVYVLAKSRVGRFKRRADDEVIESIVSPVSSFVSRPSSFVPRRTLDYGRRTKGRDLKNGMDLLTREFLVDVVEKTDSAGKLDISMRCMCFDELVRRNELFALSSEALKVYVLNEGELFSKTIRLAAMAQLADRTGHIGPTAQ